MEARGKAKTFARVGITTRKLEEEIKQNWRRFDFGLALASGFASRYAGGASWHWRSPPVAGINGRVDYAPAFAALGA